MSLTKAIKDYLLAKVANRAPDRIIGGNDNPYMLRWFVIPRNKWFNIYLHHFLRSDDDRALHNHPWLFNASILLEGEYREHKPTITYKGGLMMDQISNLKAGAIRFRFGQAFHRIELLVDEELRDEKGRFVWREKPVWTLFITGPEVREWSFACPQGLVHHKLFTSADGNEVGKGCDQ